MFAMMLWIFFVQLIAGFQPRPPLSVVRRHEHFVKLDPEVEAKTKKFGLEGGLFSIFTSEDKESKGSQAAELLKQYGAAYLITSISLAIVSFSICYALVDNGVDVSSLLSKLNIDATATTEKAGTVAIAYTAHKAASPIRFPPTVALTPVVAKLLKKKEDVLSMGYKKQKKD